MSYCFSAPHARRRLHRRQPRWAFASDVLMKPRRFVDATVPMLERQRPILQRVNHRAGDRVVVIGDILFGDLVARIENAIGTAENDLMWVGLQPDVTG